ncbi:Calpain-5 [Orchesella cincta]|uniref:Calpain-5 n=1 Tax=Orchesella cincta TaxID=48709 RepID=A0A1D2N7E8_ORCCI|nr:Calpain-5 [Orchesella cincta]
MGWGNGDVIKFKGQSYGKLRRKYMETKELFEDPLFPPNDNSFGLGRQLTGRVQWKRPTELTESPRLFVEKASSKDVTQGRLGNCWLVAACAALTTVKELWKTVVPDYKLQEWDPTRPEQYAGIFHFRFWRTGKWIDVVIDDLLPVDAEGQLIFCHSTTQNEFWSALLEKAYAKLCGSYGALDGGNLCDALIDFTSGIGEMINLREGYSSLESKEQLRKQMLRRHDEHALMCCAISTSDSALFETRTKTGLVIGHAYGITSVKEINIGQAGLLSIFKTGEKITLLRLRNPWGSKEWTGAFSDGSPEWVKIPKSEKEKLGLTFEDDGEIPYEDFAAEFTDLSVCQLVNTSIFSLRKTWSDNNLFGQWTKPHRAGGCPNHDTFLRNPQYYFDVPKDGIELMVQIIQTDRRGVGDTSSSRRADYNSIGFHIMRVEDNREHRLHKMQKKAVTSDYCKTRSMFFQGNLDEGRYVVVPTTFEPGIETEFLMRVYSDAAITVKELTHDYPEPHWMCTPFCSAPTCVTVITVEGASELKAENTYCIIKVEGEQLRSNTVEGSYSPTWNLKGIFFRTDICKPIVVELWENRTLQRDHFLGNAVLTGSADNQMTSVKAPLVGRGQKQSERHPGEMKVVFITYDDLSSA